MNRSMPGLPVHHKLPEFTQTSIESVMPSSRLILCRPLLLLPPIPPSLVPTKYVPAKYTQDIYEENYKIMMSENKGNQNM